MFKNLNYNMTIFLLSFLFIVILSGCNQQDHIANIREWVDAYETKGKIGHSLAQQLKDNLEQAEQHWDKGSKWQSIEFMENFLEQLHSSNNNVTEKQEKALTKEAEKLIKQWMNTSREFGIVIDFVDMEIVDQSADTKFFSNNGTVQFEVWEEGHHLTYAFDAPKSDNYEITLKPFRAPSYGNYRVLIDDQEVASVNFHSLTGGPPGIGEFETLTSVNLTAGGHEIKFLNVGKVEESSNFKLGVIQLQILDAKAQRDRDDWEGK